MLFFFLCQLLKFAVSVSIVHSFIFVHSLVNSITQ